MRVGAPLYDALAYVLADTLKPLAGRTYCVVILSAVTT